MSLAQEYIEASVELAKAERFEELARLVDRRLRDSGEPLLVPLVQGERSIVSPPLEIDEPDRNALLYEIFYVLESKREAAGIETMRRVVVELLMQGLNRGEPEDYLKLAAHLVGHTLVVENIDLGIRLQQQLYGYLASRLSKPFPQLIELEGDELTRATLAIDVWLAVMPVEPSWPQHMKQRVEALFDISSERLERGDLGLESRFELLSFAYQVLLKARPRLAGQKLWRVCRLLANGTPRQLRRLWLDECRHLALELSTAPDWRQNLIDGVELSPWFPILESPGLHALMEEALASLGIENEIETTKITAGQREGAGVVTPYPFDDLGRLGRTLYESSSSALARAMRSVTRNDPLLCSV